MLKPLAILFFSSMTVLAGCSTTAQQSAGYYILDRQQGRLCQSSHGECIPLSIIASQNGRLPNTVRVYQQPISGPNYPRSLINLLLNPAHLDYVATPEPGSEERFRLPKNAATDTVWRELQATYYQVYQ